jgi:ABC-type enterochelin transport system substrate-binding protein
MRSNVRHVVAPMLVAVALAACSSSSSTSTTTSAATPAASGSAATCASLQALQSSVDALIHINPVDVGVQGIQDQLTKVQASADAVEADASSDLAPQITSLKDALATVGTTLSSGANVSTIATQLATQLPAVAAAWGQVVTTAQSMNCNLSST